MFGDAAEVPNVRVSTAEIRGEVVEPVKVANRVSVPAPPLIVSKEFRVAVEPPAPPSDPSIKSSAAVPTIEFAPVVSGQV
jgi:hypothetical protein